MLRRHEAVACYSDSFCRVTCPFLWKSKHNFIPAICCSKFSRFEFVRHNAGTKWLQFLMWHPVHCFYNNAVLSIRFVFVCTSLLAYCLYNMRPRVHTKGGLSVHTSRSRNMSPSVCWPLKDFQDVTQFRQAIFLEKITLQSKWLRG